MIPENLKTGFDILSKMSMEEVGKIADLIHRIPVGSGPMKIAEELEFHLKLNGSIEIAEVLHSFGGLLLDIDIPKEGAAAILSQSFPNPKDVEEKLKLIFDRCDNLKLTAKAAILQSENNFVYKNSKIISDVRYLFGSQNEISNEDGRFGVLIHQLRVTAYHNRGNREFFITLDKEDLVKMKKQIDRALDKHNFIQDSLKDKVQFIELTE